MTWEEHHIVFMNQLDKKSNDELVDCFNEAVGIRAFGIARSAYLSALEEQLAKREIDFSEVGNKTSISYARKVKLVNNKLVIINENIIYIDSDDIEVTLTTLLFRVDRVNEILGSIDKFQEIVGGTIGTNGELIVMKEMQSPAVELEGMIEERLAPLGFKYKEHFVFLSEQLTQGVLGREADYESPFNKPIPGSENIHWLETIILEHGQFAKFLKDEV